MSGDPRALALSSSLVEELELDLKGLVVLTECASGPYAYAPLIALRAGADVIAVGADSMHGSFDSTRTSLLNLVELIGRAGQIRVVDRDHISEVCGEADIVTNSGMVRPLSAHVIAGLKSTAVIPLMWETWEFRPEDIDLAACQSAGVPVIGTNENHFAIRMFGYNAFIAIKLCFELGLEVYRNSIALLGSGPTARPIAEALTALGVDLDWFSSVEGEGSFHYRELGRLIERPRLDAIIIAETQHRSDPLEQADGLSFAALAERFPALRVGHIAGGIDAGELKLSGLAYLPERIRPPGYMSYQAADLGPRPVLELFAAGLKVGQLAAGVRREGGSVEDAIAVAVADGIGMDFPGGFADFVPNVGGSL